MPSLLELAAAAALCSYPTTHDVVRDLHRAATQHEDGALVEQVDRILTDYADSLPCLEHTPDRAALVLPYHLGAELVLPHDADRSTAYLLSAVRMAPDLSPAAPLQVDVLWDPWALARQAAPPAASLHMRVPAFVDGRYLAAGTRLRLPIGTHLVQRAIGGSLESRRLELTQRSDLVIDGRARQVRLATTIAGTALVVAGITTFSFFGQRAAMHAQSASSGLGWTLAPAIAGGTLTALGVGTVAVGALFEPNGAAGLVITGRF